jgi:hypothetical protein
MIVEFICRKCDEPDWCDLRLCVSNPSYEFPACPFGGFAEWEITQNGEVRE